MKKIIFTLILFIVFSCKKKEELTTETIKASEEVLIEEVDTIVEVLNNEPKKTVFQLKEALLSKGFKVDTYVDAKTKDTILMQQYFIAFLKQGDIRRQNEEEIIELRKEHKAHLDKMFKLGYADVSESFESDGEIKGITIYNVPTKKVADSLAKIDPMVKAGCLKIEIHPWWVKKGFALK